MPHLFDALRLRGVTFRNRIGVSPMCQYSATEDGLATDWHLVHLGSRATAGAALVIAEATAVEARGRISRFDLGIWDEAQLEPLARIARFIEEQGSVAGIQIAHAGRKASLQRPWQGGRPLSPDEGSWRVFGPSPVPFGEGYPVPTELSRHELSEVRQAFGRAAQRARRAGFRFLEVHAAHGYLLHSFLSPLSNRRDDEYGGSFENRARFLLETTREVREHWRSDHVLAVRISATDWLADGWTLDETIQLAKLLEREGVDVVDCSSGGTSTAATIPLAPGYQVGFAEAVRRATALSTAAVGLITEPEEADRIVASGAADLVLLGRELLRKPSWPTDAARALKRELEVPAQYRRAF